MKDGGNQAAIPSQPVLDVCIESAMEREDGEYRWCRKNVFACECVPDGRQRHLSAVWDMALEARGVQGTLRISFPCPIVVLGGSNLPEGQELVGMFAYRLVSGHCRQLPPSDVTHPPMLLSDRRLPCYGPHCFVSFWFFGHFYRGSLACSFWALAVALSGGLPLGCVITNTKNPPESPPPPHRVRFPVVRRHAVLPPVGPGRQHPDPHDDGPVAGVRLRRVCRRGEVNGPR